MSHGNPKHGLVGTPEYRAWRSMIERCENERYHHYNRYGGRGIKVCAEWRSDAAVFVKDMGLKPSAKHTLDRIDNDGPYENGNCRWATKREQQLNQCRNHFLSFAGERLTLTEWAERVGLKYNTLKMRIKAGWPVERALMEPSH